MIDSYDRLKSGNRWRFYVCGRRKREGIAGCHTGKLKASLIGGAVMRQVRDRILTTSYARTLLQAVNRKLNEETVGLDGEIARVRRRLSEVNGAIYNLLDLAERDGSAAAGERLAEREVARRPHERRCLQEERSPKEVRRSHRGREKASQALVHLPAHDGVYE